MKSILFVCTHNSARSQIAEGLVNYYYGDNYRAYSAGTEKTSVNPLAIEVMKLLGIDISQHTSQHIDDFMSQQFDLVVTVCDNAKETCPYFPMAIQRKHISLSDPSNAEGTYQEQIQAFIKTRDEIKKALPNLLGITSV